jgi:hypothetical protein
MAVFSGAFGGAENVGMIFRMDADSKDAVKEIDRAKAGITGLVSTVTSSVPAASSSMGALGTAASALTGPVGLAAAAVTGLAAVGVTAGIALFGLASKAAEYGSAIFDASKKTGLHAEALTALKYAAETSGASFETIVGNVSKFNVLLGEANNGSDKASATLKQYGITATNTSGALEQAITVIHNMTDADEKGAAAKALFKDRTAAILPVIDSFSGDLPGLISKLKELGLTMSDEDAKAADEFGDQVDTLTMQLSALGRMIGQEVMPIFNEMARDISDWLSKNKGEVKSWAESISYWTRRVIGEVKELLLLYEQARDFGTRNNYDNGGYEGYLQRQAKRDVEMQMILNQRAGKEIAGGGGLHGQFDELTAPPVYAPKRYKEADDDDKPKKEKAPKVDKDPERTQAQAYKDFIAALKEIIPGYKGPVGRQGKRSRADQQSLYSSLPRGEAAVPGTSSHEFYKGLDLDESIPLDLVKKAAAAANVIIKKTFIHKGTGLHRHVDFVKGSEADKERGGGEEEIADAAEKAAKEQKEKDEKAAKDTIANERETMEERIAIFESGQERKAAAIEEYAEHFKLTEREVTEFQEELQAESLDERKKLLEDYIAVLKQVGPEGVEPLRQATLKLKLLEDEIETNRSKRAIKNRERDKDELEDRKKIVESWNDYVKKVIEATEAEDERANHKSERQADEEGGLGGILGGFLGGFGGPGGFGDFSVWEESIDAFGNKTNVLKDAATAVSDAWSTSADVVGAALGQMASGLASMLAAWLSGADVSGKALLQMTSQIALQLAAQAAIEGIMETARGLAALALTWGVPNPKSIAHFAAAGVFLAVAGTAAAVGIAAGLGARAMGDGKSKATNSAGAANSAPRRDTYNSENQGQGYSSHGDEAYIHEEGRESPSPIGVAVEISFKDKPNWFGDMFEAQWRTNGKVRRLVEDGR